MRYKTRYTQNIIILDDGIADFSEILFSIPLAGKFRIAGATFDYYLNKWVDDKTGESLSLITDVSDVGAAVKTENLCEAARRLFFGIVAARVFNSLETGRILRTLSRFHALRELAVFRAKSAAIVCHAVNFGCSHWWSPHVVGGGEEEEASNSSTLSVLRLHSFSTRFFKWLSNVHEYLLRSGVSRSTRFTVCTA